MWLEYAARSCRSSVKAVYTTPDKDTPTQVPLMLYLLDQPNTRHSLFGSASRMVAATFFGSSLVMSPLWASHGSFAAVGGLGQHVCLEVERQYPRPGWPLPLPESWQVLPRSTAQATSSAKECGALPPSLARVLAALEPSKEPFSGRFEPKCPIYTRTKTNPPLANATTPPPNNKQDGKGSEYACDHLKIKCASPDHVRLAQGEGRAKRLSVEGATDHHKLRLR